MIFNSNRIFSQFSYTIDIIISNLIRLLYTSTFVHCGNKSIFMNKSVEGNNLINAFLRDIIRPN